MEKFLCQKQFMKNKALVGKRLSFYGEKRLREIYHPFVNRELKSKHFLASLVRNSFIERKQRKLVRPFWSFKRWKKQFLFFQNLIFSRFLGNQVLELNRGTAIEVFVLRSLFLKRLLMERRVSLKRYDGVVDRVKGKKKATSSLVFHQSFKYGERISHRIFPHSPNLLAIGKFF